ncbi:DoxX family protein [Paraburkholderia silviterrae]|uniref:DoxX family protein n=1 Tax=Paraburkholderia silviterrae TaxID=2528715 RepID=A0A4R5MFZ2_9BURK|nr:DoxX family protein [Paraburkholderia silviterrae]TDG25957.1 DoxX family protein [Paraburkholderia silviterrae]
MKTLSYSGNDVNLLAGRFLIAAIFVISGVLKLISPSATIGYITAMGLPAPMLGYIGSMVLELACATLLILGYRTRVVAWVLAIYCVVTAIVFHHALSDQNQMFNFLKNLAMAGGLLAFSTGGAGVLSMDYLVGRRASNVAPSTL